MTAQRVTGGAPVGIVLAVDTGVARVLTDGGERRASYGPRLLGAVARDRASAPAAGDWVRLRAWPDGRLTMEECLTRAPRSTSGSASDPASDLGGRVVVPFRGRRHRA